MAKGLKVRRSKKLYKKKKSTIRKVTEAVIMFAVTGALAFVGFTVGKAVLNYKPPVDVDKPKPPSAEETQAVTEGEIPPEEITNGENPNNSPKELGMSMTFAPPDALTSAEALAAFIETALSSGNDTIVFELKDGDGLIRYLSDIEVIRGDGAIIVGTLTAEQIASACNNAGITPLAQINTLKDHTATEKIADTSYVDWIDNVPGLGKRWANPYFRGTQIYIAEIVAELDNAGFNGIIFADTIYPKPYFTGIDASILPAEVVNSETRYGGLKDFVNAVTELNADANIMLKVEYNALSGGVPLYSAEILRNGGDTLNVGGIMLYFNAADFGNVLSNAATTETAVKAAFDAVTSYSKDLTVMPLLDGAGLDETQRKQLSDAFDAIFDNKLIIFN